ncbi:ABC transporter [Bifidobacterium margollesii]|uniref:ABC transporter n=1 Tax=Bifidobacterium margollesii TaxID=2020964 RepID=A0A2N5JBD3_9BIFI|nr:ABC transporter permease subunit [Bifidobacterium margollesii]PLS31523.1 ABC transporter [Bifidobacterium margollesii]
MRFGGTGAVAAMILRELKANAKALLIWSVAIALFNVAGVMKFEGVAAGDPEAVRRLTDAFPKVALAVMGISDLDMSTFAGYYAVLEFYAGIMAAVYAVALARNAVSRELTDGTYEFLFVRPVSRATILTAKLAAALADAVAFVAVNLVSSLLCLGMLENGDVPGLSSGSSELSGGSASTVVWRFAVWLLVMMLVFGAIGACAAALCPNPDRGAAVGNASVVAAYCAGVVYDMFSDHDASTVARVLSPFRYATPGEVIDGRAPVPFVVLAAVIVVAGCSATYVAFARRDLVAR